ncbi:MAG TPA: hypothetical protein VLA46_05685 [Saprospiraceae bacterium]|nr:hypothetical protein [Saprospiraceae bacterium]
MPEDIHWQKYSARYKTYPLHLEAGEPAPGLVVCIPVYAEPDLIATLESLLACDLPDTGVEVLLLFNMSSRMTKAEVRIHHTAWQEMLAWINLQQLKVITFRPVFLDVLPDPKGGVGWARKIVLDEAARLLNQEGVMLCLDSDCTVARNYLKVVYEYFKMHPGCNAVSIYYEHNLDTLGQHERHAIIQYELHLRYLVRAMRWAGHPFAFQTVGSSMAVRRKGYLAHGGMNTRQAGEDFYFLQKFIEVDSLQEIKNTIVYPSARISDRVPFGTGRAMSQLLPGNTAWMTADFKVFMLIKPLLYQTDELRKLLSQSNSDEKFEAGLLKLQVHPDVISFLKQMDFEEHCREILLHTSTYANFRRRFFRYFNSFMMIRYMHYMRDHFFADVPIEQAAKEMYQAAFSEAVPGRSIEEMLLQFRQLDRQ